MKRRTFLGVVVAASVGAGCLGSPSRSSPPSEDVIRFEELPPEAREEFTAALEGNGVKECDIALLGVEQSIVEYRGEYYSYAVQSGSGGGSTEECAKDFLNVEKVEEFS